MAQYTAKDLRNITKNELCELLKKEGIEFDEKMSYFALRALLLNPTKNDDSMGRKKETTVAETEPVVKNETVVETPSEQPVAKTEKPKNTLNSLTALRSEIVRRKGGFGLGKSAFAAELAKRRGERVSGVTFAQELKTRQLKYGK